MLPTDHNEDLTRLRNEGIRYSIVKGTFLVVIDIPYLNSKVELKSGTLIVKLDMSGGSLISPIDHTAFWAGEHPCNMDGSYLVGLVSGPNRNSIGDGIVHDFFLSSKPITNGGKYESYYAKVKHYINMISNPARGKYPLECARIASGPVACQGGELPFVYADTNASRANITGISESMEHQKLAIVGLGGTGMYLLDLLSKCPVEEIHLFDDDIFNNHNAFRAPGAASLDVLRSRPTKVRYAADIYGQMKRNVIPHCEKITPENICLLDDMSFIFICVDSSDVRNMIANYLIDRGKSFIDSGLGLEIVNGHIVGQVRVTSAINGHYDHLQDALSSQGENEGPYASNIQIAELNSLAAVLSVIRWKKLLEVYADTSSSDELNFVYCVDTNNIIKPDKHEDQ